MLQVDKIDIVTAAMGHALATEGGFCTGSARVIDHQVLPYDNIKNNFTFLPSSRFFYFTLLCTWINAVAGSSESFN